MSSDRTPAPADVFPGNVLRASLFLIGAVLTFPVVAAFVAAAAPGLAVLQHRAMPALAANHMVTLGWGTMVAMGALHQMLPAAVGVRREASPLMPVQFVIHGTGVVVLAAGFLLGSHPLIIAGGSAVVGSVLVFLGLAATIVRQRRRTLPALRYVAASLVCLAATVSWGLLLAVNRAFTVSTALLMPVGLAVHLVLGLIGWFAFLIVGVSYYLLPRFAGIKDPPAHPYAVFAGLVAGLVMLVVGALVAPALVRAGLLCTGMTGLLYATDLSRVLRSWRPRGRDIVRAHWQVLAAETALLGAGAAAWAVGVLPGDGIRWGVAGVTLFLLGWVTLAITGQAYKVTPFLMWYYRFHMGLSAYEVPRLEEPYWPPAGVPPFLLLAAAAPLIALGVLLASPRLSLAGGLAYVGGALVFSFVLGYSWLPAFRRGRRASSSAEAR
jgi:hypothetical protein